MNSDLALSRTFSALADPTRRAILARLSGGPCTVKQLSEPFTISAPAVTKHLRVLETAGLITRGREAQTRPCTLDGAPLVEVARFIERYRRFWETSLNQLGAHLEKVQAEARPEKVNKANPRSRRKEHVATRRKQS